MKTEFAKSENGETLVVTTTHPPVIENEYYDYDSLISSKETKLKQIGELNKDIEGIENMLLKFDELEITKPENK